MNTSELGALLDLLLAKGVSKYKGSDGTEIEFGRPQFAPSVPDTPVIEDETETDIRRAFEAEERRIALAHVEGG